MCVCVCVCVCVFLACCFRQKTYMAQYHGVLNEI